MTFQHQATKQALLIKQLRSQFPLLATEANGQPLCYMDNASTTPMPTIVLDALQQFETCQRGNVSRAGHYLAAQANDAYEKARSQVATYINAPSADEIIFTSGTTAAINLLAHSLGSLFKPGDEVVISLAEHHSNFIPWQMLRDRSGIILKAIPLQADGQLDLSTLDNLVTERCRLIAVSHASNVTGAITDIKTITAAAHRVGAEVLIDGAQAVPHGPVDVQAMGVDYYTFSGHKCFGPTGIGALWVRQQSLDKLPPFMGGGSMVERVTLEANKYPTGYKRFEAGTPAIAQAIGMGAALEWLTQQPWPQLKEHESALTQKMLAVMNNIPGLSLIGPSSVLSQSKSTRLPIFSFDIKGHHPHDICYLLDQQGIALRGGHHCAQPLMDNFNLMGCCRASLSLLNTVDEIDNFALALQDTIKELES